MAGAARSRSDIQPGGHPLRAEVVAHHRRQRIMVAAAAVVAERGYRNVTVADIVKTAAIARKRFYEHFASKEDCFFAVYDRATEDALEAVAEACNDAAADLPDRVSHGLSALLAYVEANPQTARACIVEGPAVGPAINQRFDAVIDRFAALLRAGRASEQSAELPAGVEETVVGGLYWLLYYALLEKRPKRVGSLLPQLVDFSLIPFGAAAVGTADAE